MAHRVEQLAEGVTLHLADCRDVLPSLAGIGAVVTDPPYGISVAKDGHVAGGTSSAKWKAAKRVDYGVQDWDAATCDDAVMQAVKVAPYSVIFGGNYYALPPSSCWLVWDKETNGHLADCELAWTNLPKSVKRIRYLWNGFARANGEPRGDHPTQKPVGVMDWVINQLPAEARLICDPFCGSGTTGVSCVRLGRQFVGIEKQERYFDISCRRIADELKRPRLFAEPTQPPVQEALFA